MIQVQMLIDVLFNIKEKITADTKIKDKITADTKIKEKI